MSENDLFNMINLIGYKKDCYRFDMLIPRAMLGKGKKFPLYNSDCEPDESSAWVREDCKFPIKYVVGAHLVNGDNGMVRIGVLLDTKQLVSFIKVFLENIKEFNDSYSILEFIPGECNGT